MKYLSLILACFILACSPAKDDAVPSDLEGKRALLAEKIAEKEALELTIQNLRSEIKELNPDGDDEVVVVAIDTIVKEKFTRYIDLQGLVASEDLVNASSEMGGRILQLMVKEGQRVSKGQLIGKTDTESIRTQKDELMKSLDLAKDVYDRQKRLWEQNIGSEIQYLQAKNNKERLEKSLLTIEAQMKKSNVYAPISGVVDVVYLKQGEVAGPGMPIVQILNTSRVKVVSDVPETYLGKVKVGNKVEVNFPSISKTMTRPVTMLGRTIDPSNRTFKLEILMDNPGNELKPNLLSVIKISDFVLKDAIVVPLELIQQEVSGQKYLFVAEKKDNKWTAKKVDVTTGESTEGSIIITAGLKAGDLIITKGARSMSEGQPILPENVKE